MLKTLATIGPRLKRWQEAYDKLSDYDKEKEREVWREARLKAIELDEQEKFAAKGN